MRETQELVAIVPWTFIAQILNLFIQLGLIKRFLFKPVGAVLEKRREIAEAQLQDARIAMRDAESRKEAYGARLSMAHKEAAQLLQNAEEQAERHREALLREAQAQAAQIRASAEADIVRERKKAANALKNEIGSIAVDIASKVVEREISEKDHRKLIEACIRNAGAAS